jgi:hypothetical protein
MEFAEGRDAMKPKRGDVREDGMVFDRIHEGREIWTLDEPIEFHWEAVLRLKDKSQKRRNAVGGCYCQITFYDSGGIIVISNSMIMRKMYLVNKNTRDCLIFEAIMRHGIADENITSRIISCRDEVEIKFKSIDFLPLLLSELLDLIPSSVTAGIEVDGVFEIQSIESDFMPEVPPMVEKLADAAKSSMSSFSDVTSPLHLRLTPPAAPDLF